MPNWPSFGNELFPWEELHRGKVDANSYLYNYERNWYWKPWVHMGNLNAFFPFILFNQFSSFVCKDEPKGYGLILISSYHFSTHHSVLSNCEEIIWPRCFPETMKVWFLYANFSLSMQILLACLWIVTFLMVFHVPSHACQVTCNQPFSYRQILKRSYQNIFLEPAALTIWMPPKQFYWNHDHLSDFTSMRFERSTVTFEYKTLKLAYQEVCASLGN